MCHSSINVDDLLLTGSATSKIERLQTLLKSQFEMTDLGPATFYLGFQFVYTDTGIWLTQTTYIRFLVNQLRLSECNPCSVPMHEGFKLQNDMAASCLLISFTVRTDSSIDVPSPMFKLWSLLVRCSFCAKLPAEKVLSRVVHPSAGSSKFGNWCEANHREQT